MNIQLTEHFTLQEMIASDTATQENINNRPMSLDVVLNLKKTAELLEQVRSELGDLPITVTSGYRCQDLNEAVGGVADSQHLTGSAADFVAPDFGSSDQVYEKIKESEIEFDQLIREYGDWVHISQSDDPRNECVVY